MSLETFSDFLCCGALTGAAARGATGSQTDQPAMFLSFRFYGGATSGGGTNHPGQQHRLNATQHRQIEEDVLLCGDQ